MKSLKNIWNRFKDKHPKAAKWIYQIFFFIVFSEGVTIFQYLAFTFLPYAFGSKMASTAFMWPAVEISLFGVDFTWCIFGADVIYNAAGEAVIGGGLGYFISYEIGTFLAQCINFPLQRNITFKSHGKIWFQAIWYFIAWVIISVLCNCINNLWMPLAAHIVAPAVYNILVTVIFFFVFRIIFPEGKAKDNGNMPNRSEKTTARA